MTYRLVGHDATGRDTTKPVVELVLEGKAFRRTLVTQDENADSVTSIGANYELFSEIKSRLEVIHEGAVNPMKLSRLLLKHVSAHASGSLVIWDLDHSVDYVLKLDRGFVVDGGASTLCEVMNRCFKAEGIPALDWQGPFSSEIDAQEKVAEHLRTDLPSARTVIGTVLLKAFADMFATTHVLIGWVQKPSDKETLLQLPFGDLIQFLFESTATADELASTVGQIRGALSFVHRGQWAPHLPRAASELCTQPPKNYSAAALLDQFRKSDQGALSNSAAHAALIVLINSGAVRPADQNTAAPETQSASKQRQVPTNYYRRLGVAKDAQTSGIETAYRKRVTALSEEYEASAIDDAEFNRLSRAYEVAHAILSDGLMRQAFDEARAAGVDFIGDGLEAQLLGGHFARAGERALKRRDYGDASRLFERALEYEQEADSQLLYHWSIFLDSDQSKAIGDTTIESIKAIGDPENLSDRQYLYLGKVARLIGDVEQARFFLNKAVAIEEKNQEAWGELRLLNTQKSVNKLTRGLNIKSYSSDPGTIVVFGLIILAVLYACANYIPSERTEWPRSGRTAAAQSSMKMGRYQEDLMRRVQQRHDKENAHQKDIPMAQRVWGNVEFFHLTDDSWFKTRRILLLFFGALGILLFLRGEKRYLVSEDAQYGQIFLAIPYGCLVGLLSVIPSTGTPLSSLIGMGLFTAVSEQVFFFWFLGRALLIHMEDKRMALVLMTLFFGLHELTFFMPPDAPLLDLSLVALKVMLFVGGASALALYKGRTIITPLVLHICIQMVLMLKYASVL